MNGCTDSPGGVGGGVNVMPNETFQEAGVSNDVRSQKLKSISNELTSSGPCLTKPKPPSPKC